MYISDEYLYLIDITLCMFKYLNCITKYVLCNEQQIKVLGLLILVGLTHQVMLLVR